MPIWFYYGIWWRYGWIQFTIWMEPHHRNATQLLSLLLITQQCKCLDGWMVRCVWFWCSRAHRWRDLICVRVMCLKIENATLQMHSQCKAVYTSARIKSNWNVEMALNLLLSKFTNFRVVGIDVTRRNHRLDMWYKSYIKHVIVFVATIENCRWRAPNRPSR